MVSSWICLYLTRILSYRILYFLQMGEIGLEKGIYRRDCCNAHQPCYDPAEDVDEG